MVRRLLTHARRSSAGQSTVEFALMIVLLMSVVFFVLQLALIFSFGNYVHYATFMSARALLSSRDAGGQTAAANSVLDHMLGPGGHNRFGVIGKSVNEGAPLDQVVGQDSHYSNNRPYSWLQGVRYTFRSKLFRIPMAGLGSAPGAGGAPVNSMTLTSESWLGMEPDNGGSCNWLPTWKGFSPSSTQWVTDNGC